MMNESLYHDLCIIHSLLNVTVIIPIIPCHRRMNHRNLVAGAQLFFACMAFCACQACGSMLESELAGNWT